MPARLHEHNGLVALRIDEGETIYISADLAKNIGKELALAGEQIEHGYHYPTTVVNAHKEA